jgi:hypothetical protein
MTDVIHGLVSGLIWSAILGTCLIAIAAVVTATVPARRMMRSTAVGMTRASDSSPIPEKARLGRHAILHPTRTGPRPSSRSSQTVGYDEARLPETSGFRSPSR